MKVVSFEIGGDFEWDRSSVSEERWGLPPFEWDLPDDAGTVEGVVVEWEERENGYYLTLLMSDDHAARLAVSPASGDATWSEEDYGTAPEETP